MRKTPNGLSRLGRITDQIVFVSFTWENRMKVGMTSAVAGTMTAPSRIENPARRPMKVYFANPYPASTASTVAPTPPVKAYRAEFANQRP
jgi:hypothetical protein